MNCFLGETLQFLLLSTPQLSLMVQYLDLGLPSLVKKVVTLWENYTVMRAQ